MLGCTKAVSNLQKEIQGTTNKTTKTIAMKISKATTTNTATTHSDYNKNTTCPNKDIDITYIQHHNKNIDITHKQHHDSNKLPLCCLPQVLPLLLPDIKFFTYILFGLYLDQALPHR